MAAKRGGKASSTKASTSGNIFSGVSVDMLVLGAVTSCVIVSFIGGFVIGTLAALVAGGGVP